MYIIKWQDKDFKKYLCYTWLGDIVWTLNIKRALVLPKTVCEILQKEIKNTINIETQIEETNINSFVMDKYHIENMPNV